MIYKLEHVLYREENRRKKLCTSKGHVRTGGEMKGK